MSSKTIFINPADVDVSHHENIRGVDVEFYPSPYDIPLNVSVSYNRDNKLLDIIFDYMLVEEEYDSVDYPHGGRGLLWIGRKSGRLYRIIFMAGPPRFRTTESDSKIVKALIAGIELLKSNPRRSNRKNNYKIITQIIKSFGSQIVDVVSSSRADNPSESQA